MNAYEVKAGVVYLQRKNCVIHAWALQRLASHNVALYKSSFPFSDEKIYTYSLLHKSGTHHPMTVRRDGDVMVFDPWSLQLQVCDIVALNKHVANLKRS